MSLTVFEVVADEELSVTEHNISTVPWCRGHLAMVAKRVGIKNQETEGLILLSTIKNKWLERLAHTTTSKRSVVRSGLESTCSWHNQETSPLMYMVLLPPLLLLLLPLLSFLACLSKTFRAAIVKLLMPTCAMLCRCTFGTLRMLQLERPR